MLLSRLTCSQSSTTPSATSTATIAPSASGPFMVVTIPQRPPWNEKQPLHTPADLYYSWRDLPKGTFMVTETNSILSYARSCLGALLIALPLAGCDPVPPVIPVTPTDKANDGKKTKTKISWPTTDNSESKPAWPARSFSTDAPIQRSPRYARRGKASGRPPKSTSKWIPSWHPPPRSFVFPTEWGAASSSIRMDGCSQTTM